MKTNQQILVLNAGSSSLKFEVFRIEGSKLHSEIKGICDAIGLKKSLFKSHSQAIELTLKNLQEQGVIREGSIKVIGHRVVHGGEKYTKATLINAKVLKDIEKLSELAPLHNPVNLQGIYACGKLLPQVKQVAIFDTAFYSTLPKKAWLYALPAKLYKQFGIRKYGFHGTSHQYVASEAAKLLRKKNAKLITVHLGNGCSITASVGGRALETSMGFTPLEGVIMGTRSGSIDPSIALFLQDKLKLLPNQVENILIKQSGLLALSEKSSDMRVIYAASKKKDQKSLLAIEMFCYQIAKVVASYLTVTGQPDAIVFTASIGENAHYIRAGILQYLSFLPFKLDQKKNMANAIAISTPSSKTKILVIPTNENLEIAKQAINV